MTKLEQMAEQYASGRVNSEAAYLAGARAALELAIAKLNARIQNEQSLGRHMTNGVGLLELARNDLAKLVEKGTDA